jgi:hypothetical protein
MKTSHSAAEYREVSVAHHAGSISYSRTGEGISFCNEARMNAWYGANISFLNVHK